MTTTGPHLPAGRYGPPPDPRSRRRTTLALWTLGVLGLAGALWLGWGQANRGVTWRDVSFAVRGATSVDVVFDVTRPDPGLALRCRVVAVNAAHGEVGVASVDVAPSDAATVRVSTSLLTSETAVSAGVADCSPS